MSSILSTSWDDLPYSKYPSVLDTPVLMSDITSDDLPLVNQYEAYLAANNFAAAAKIITDNPGLDSKLFNAAKLNRVDNRTIAMERTINNLLEDFMISRLTYIAEYSADTTYEKTNIVSFNGEGFMCRVDGTKGVAPTQHTTTTNWAVIAKQGIQGASGTGLAPRGEWNSTTQYYANDCAAHNNALWQCITGNTNSEPTSSNANWLQLLSNSNLVVTSSAQPVGQSSGNLWFQQL